MTPPKKLAVPDASVRAQIRKLPHDRRLYLRGMEREYVNANRDLNKARRDLAKAALNFEVWTARLADYMAQVIYQTGYFDASKHFFEIALMRCLKRPDDPDLIYTHLRVTYSGYKRTNQVSVGNLLSGYKGDSERLYREGWLKYIENLVMVDGQPPMYEHKS